MKIRHQLLSIALAGALATSLLGGLALWLTTRQADALQAMRASVTAVRQVMEGDMMHDAIRGDVLRFQLASKEADAVAQADAQKDFTEHSARFDKGMRELRESQHAPEITQAIEQARTHVAAYTEAARGMLQVRDATASSAQPRERFDHAFERLEAQMQALANLLEKQAEGATHTAQQHQAAMRWCLAAGLALTLPGLLLWAHWRAQRLSGPLVTAAHVAERIAKGDLTVSIPRGWPQDEAGQLLTSLSTMKSALALLTAQVLKSSEQVSTASGQVSSGCATLAESTQGGMRQLQASHQALQRIRDNIRGNLEQTQQAHDLAAGACDVARRGGEVVTQVVETMHGINEGSRHIADIIGVIDGIAFQTNILALNAAVEAARAGEQGRGFAVVAAEVRSLAQRSAAAAQEIKGLISTSVGRVEVGTGLVDEAGSTMTDIVAAILHVNELMEQVAQSAAQQSRDIADVHREVAQLDNAMSNNHTLVNESALAAASLMQQARELVTTASSFKL
jgi:methyl-accepting chemotaxis protein